MASKLRQRTRRKRRGGSGGSRRGGKLVLKDKLVPEELELELKIDALKQI